MVCARNVGKTYCQQKLHEYVLQVMHFFMHVLIKVGIEIMYAVCCMLAMWVTVTGHAACTYEKILNNVYIVQSRSVS